MEASTLTTTCGPEQDDSTWTILFVLDGRLVGLTADTDCLDTTVAAQRDSKFSVDDLLTKESTLS